MKTLLVAVTALFGLLSRTYGQEGPFGENRAYTETLTFQYGWQVDLRPGRGSPSSIRLGTFGDATGDQCLAACDANGRLGTTVVPFENRCRLAQYNMNTGVCTGFSGSTNVTFTRNADTIVLTNNRKRLYQTYINSYPDYPNCPGFNFDRAVDSSYLMTLTLQICNNLCIIAPRCSAVMYAADSTVGHQNGQCWFANGTLNITAPINPAPTSTTTASPTTPPSVLGYLNCLYT